FEIAGGKGSVDASRICGGGVRSHAALVPLRSSCWRVCKSRRRRPRRQHVEAGERLGVAIDVEYLVPCEPTVGSESYEPEVRPFEGATADAIRAEVRPTAEERVGSYGKDVIDAKRDALCHLGPRS